MTETEIMTETGIETGTGTETEIGTGIGTAIAIESLTKLPAALRDGGDAPLHHPHPTRGAADAPRNGKNSCDWGNIVGSVFRA